MAISPEVDSLQVGATVADVPVNPAPVNAAPVNAAPEVDPAFAAALYLRETLSHDLGTPSHFAMPSVGVILGSGLGSAAYRLMEAGGTAIHFATIPGMPSPHVVGHQGRLVLGDLDGLRVAMLQGRVHSYEGHSTPDLLFGIRLLAHLGIQQLIVTNAAGGISSSLAPGDLMVIQSHLRPLATCCPDLSGISSRPCDFGSDSSHALWNPELRKIARGVPTPLNVHEGVYAMMTGPNYETPAEIRMLKFLGADAVGMSTIPEALWAASRGISVLGVSCITNVAAGLSAQSLNHEEVTATASSVETEFVSWLWKVLQRLGTNPSE